MTGREWIDEYVACYDVTNNKDLQIGRAHAIKHANLPEKLYKFRAVNEYALNNLRDATIWLSSPSKYNDPYDCMAAISAKEINAGVFKLPKASIEELRKSMSDAEISEALASNDPMGRLAQMALSRDPSVAPDKLSAMVEDLRRATDHVMQEFLQESIASVREGMKVCSFCDDYETILMWSHYAANHTGFCMEYEVPQLPEQVRHMLYPVIYSKELFNATRFFKATMSSDLSGFNNLYSTLQALYKAAEWAYEREWRLVLGFGILDQDQNLAFGKVSRVLLGAQISDLDKQIVLEDCSSRGIPVSQMRLAPTEYRMVAAPISGLRA